MKKDELIQLIKMYQEWEHDLDESACPTGWVTCSLCDGGGNFNKRYKSLPKHRDDCPRLKFNNEHK
jgi:hypothetical protein